MLNAFRTSTTYLNPQLLVSRLASSSLATGVRVRAARSYATETALPSTSSANPVASVEKGKKSDVIEGPLRPHLGVGVNPNHGLWAFFRKTVGGDNAESYETLEKVDPASQYSGRAWSAAELRRKSFKDLHTLWYVVLRERNLLETQLLEVRRLGVVSELTPIKQRMFRCRKTMARIKYVINERRVSYEGAVKIIAEGSAEVPSETNETLEVKDQSKEEPAPLSEEPPAHRSAAERAAAGLVQPD